MRKTALTFAILISALSLSCNAQDKKETSADTKTVVEVSGNDFDFGKIEEGSDYTHIFKITNGGKTALVINQVSSPCGCTSPFWTKEPIQPGKSGEVKAIYHSSGRVGDFHKTLSMQTSLGEGKDVFLNFRGQVAAKSEKTDAKAHAGQ
jgi:hypothetical protein